MESRTLPERHLEDPVITVTRIMRFLGACRARHVEDIPETIILAVITHLMYSLSLMVPSPAAAISFHNL